MSTPNPNRLRVWQIVIEWLIDWHVRWWSKWSCSASSCIHCQTVMMMRMMTTSSSVSSSRWVCRSQSISWQWFVDVVLFNKFTLLVWRQDAVGHSDANSLKPDWPSGLIILTLASTFWSRPEDQNVGGWWSGTMDGRSRRWFFWISHKRSIPKPDPQRKDFIQWESLGTDMLSVHRKAQV